MDNKIIYQIITDLWQFIKKYLANIGKSNTDEYWEKLIKESNDMYQKYKGEGENVEQFVRSVIKAAATLIESEYKKGT